MRLRCNIQVIFQTLLVLLSLVYISGCNKDDSPAKILTGTVTDIDGNIYKTISVGSQVWMAENLKTTRYSNGDSIPDISDAATWASLSGGASCNFKPDSVSVALYGRLYNHFAASDSRNICPEGWHIPSDDEWKQLEMFLGMARAEADKLNWRGTDQGDKLKVIGGNTTYWAKSSDTYEIFGTNESGFTGIGGACRVFNGEWGEITHTGFWWSSSVSGNDACYRSLDYNKSGIFRYFGSRNYGFSIRCIKD
jgi:uncharacterized protein (TIGR02145 family)